MNKKQEPIPGTQVEYDVDGRKMLYRLYTQIERMTTGNWWYTPADNIAWRPVNSPEIRQLLDAGEHPRTDRRPLNWYRVTFTSEHKDPEGNNLIMMQRLQAYSGQDAVDRVELSLDHVFNWRVLEDYEINCVDIEYL